MQHTLGAVHQSLKRQTMFEMFVERGVAKWRLTGLLVFWHVLDPFSPADCVLRVHSAISADLGQHIYPLYALISSTFSCYCCEVGLYLHLVPTVPHFPRLSQGVPPIAHTRGCATLVHRNCMTVFVLSLSDVWCCRLLPRASRAPSMEVS